MRVFGDLQSAQLENLAAAPANAPTGRVYFDTVLNVPSVYNGVAWVSMTTSAPTTAGAVYSTGAAFASVAFAAHGNMVFGVNSGGTAPEYKALALGSTGTDFALVNSVGGITLNLPDASATARGVANTGTQTFAGTKTFTGKLLLNDGSGANPSYAFMNEPTSGFYLVGTGHIRVQLAGSTVWDWTTTAMNSSLPMRLGDGSGANPTYSFSGEINTGMYRIGVANLGFVAGGSLGAQVLATGLTTVSGTAGNPGYSFISDLATGMYSTAASQLAFSVGGTQALLMGSFGLNTFNGGNWKVKIFTGSIAGVGNTTLTTPSGNILAVFGFSSVSGSASNSIVMGNSSGTPATIIYFDTSTSLSTIRLVNASGSTNTYTVMMFYA